MTYKRLLLLLILISVFFAGQAYGQTWSGILAPDRAADWSKAGVPSGIPNRTTVCATLSSGASVSQINSAISSCPSGQVVQLNAGTYNLSGMINSKDNVTLRGAGASATLLNFSGGGSCQGFQSTVCIFNGDGFDHGSDNTANWTGGHARGSTTITLSSTSQLQAGMLLYLDQQNYSSDPNGPWHCFSTSNPDCSQNSQGQYGIGRQGRSQQQVVRVTAVNGNNVSITPGVYAPNWDPGRSPGAWWGSAQPRQGFGLEDLSITTSVRVRVMMFNAHGNWVKGVRIVNSQNAAGTHVFLYQSAHNTVRDSYFYGGNPASEGYGIDSGYNSGDNLFENNIFHHMPTGMNTEGDTGSVYGHNLAVHNNFGGSYQQADAYSHGGGTGYTLREGNISSGFVADNINGTGCCVTLFRNFVSGKDQRDGGTTEHTMAVQLYSYNRYHNVVGNIMGTPGYHQYYQQAPPSSPSGGTAWKSIYNMGFGDNNGVSGQTADDPLVVASTMRWGNWVACSGDSKCNVTRFDTSEAATGVSKYPGLSNPSQNLPASFYHSSRPSWWGSMPWPAIGPDVTGGDASQVALSAAQRNMVYLNPAARCYFNVMGGTINSGPLTFNASQCYTGTSTTQNRPAPPTNLGAAVVE
jgi:hypothetical protein